VKPRCGGHDHGVKRPPGGREEQRWGEEIPTYK